MSNTNQSDYEKDWGVPQDAPPSSDASYSSNNQSNYEKDWGVAPSNPIDKLPFLFRLGLSLNKPVSQGFPERAQALGRGFTDIGEGAKQLYLNEFGSPEKAANYTKQVENERKFYESTPAGKDLTAQSIRSQTASLPYVAATGAFAPEASLLKRMLMGGGGSAAAAGIQFTPEDQSRAANMVKAGVFGTALGAAPELANFGEKTANIASKIPGKVAFPFKYAFKDLTPLEKQSAQANEAVQGNEQELEVAKEASQAETGTATPISTRAKKQIQLNNLKNPEVSNLPIQSSQEAGQNLENAKMNNDLQNQNLSNVENQLHQHLNQGAVHDVDAASQILDAQEGKINPETGRREGGIRDNISKQYDSIKDDFSKKNVIIDNTDDLKNAQNRFSQLVKSIPSQAHTPEALNLLNEIDRLKSSPTSIPADEYLTMVRSAKDYAREARKKAFTPDMNAEDRAEWEKRYNELDDTVEDMENNLENSVGPADSSRLNAANRAWRTQVKPLQRNNTYQTILKRGRIEGNIMQKLRGTDPGDVLMRGIIHNNPELLKNVVGQQYADNPTALKNAGRLVTEYTDKMPELNNLLEQHSMAEHAANRSKDILDETQENHNRILDQEKKSFKEAETQQKKSQEINDKRRKLEDDIKVLDKNIERIKLIRNKKNLSLKDKIKIEKELSDNKIARDKARNTLWKIGALGVVGTGVGLSYRGYRVIKSVLNNNQGTS